jgi:hypothetical protein
LKPCFDGDEGGYKIAFRGGIMRLKIVRQPPTILAEAIWQEDG